MANFKLNDDGYIQNPETKSNDELYKVEILRDKLTISLPHIEDYVNALNEAREYKNKYNALKDKYDKIAPVLQKDKSIFENILTNLKYLPRESKEFSGIKKFIIDIDNILKNR